MSIEDVLPTDNYYKFCAFSGILIVLAAIYLAVTMNFKIEDRLGELRMKMAGLEADVKSLDEKINFYDAIIKAYKTATKTSLVSNGLEYTESEIKDMSYKIIDLTASSRKSALELTASLGMVQTMIWYFVALAVISIFMIYAGIKLAFYGLNKWKSLDDRVSNKD